MYTGDDSIIYHKYWMLNGGSYEWCTQSKEIIYTSSFKGTISRWDGASLKWLVSAIEW